MAVEPILFFTNRLNSTQTLGAGGLTASTTANGYNKDNVRDMNLLTSWKPSDGTGDEYLQADMGSTTVLGAGAYCAISFDTRTTDQTVITLQSSSSSGSGYADVDTFTIGAAIGVSSKYLTFNQSTKQYFRLVQKNSDRGGGTRTAKIYCWAMYNTNQVLVVGSGGVYSADAMGPGEIAQVYNVSLERAASGVPLANKFAMPGQEFDLTFDPASLSLWQGLTGNLDDNAGPGNAFYIRYEGLTNVGGTSMFQMVRMTEDRWSAIRPLLDQYQSKIRLRTEPWI